MRKTYYYKPVVEGASMEDDKREPSPRSFLGRPSGSLIALTGGRKPEDAGFAGYSRVTRAAAYKLFGSRYVGEQNDDWQHDWHVKALAEG